jgi:hypothetical protein
MNRKLMVVSLSAICMAWAAVPASAGTVIGETAQGNVQANNSDQSGINGTGLAGGDTSVLGDSSPTLVQVSGNELDNLEAAAGSDSVLVANGPGGGFSQQNSSAANSRQTAVNGDSGQNIALTIPVLAQHSLNAIVGTELLAAGADNVVIGSAAQDSTAAVNSDQSANDFPGGGAPAGLDQDSLNALVNVIVLGG